MNIIEGKLFKRESSITLATKAQNAGAQFINFRGSITGNQLTKHGIKVDTIFNETVPATAAGIKQAIRSIFGK